MDWDKDADAAVKRVPFFVRKRVRKRVEEEAFQSGAGRVTMAHVTACQQRFMHNQEKEVKGYSVETCFGAGGCRFALGGNAELARQIEAYLAGLNLKEFLKAKVQGPLKMHHEFRLTIADCPNACSRPQIVDLGLIGAATPVISEAPCSHCENCVTACREAAISLNGDGPSIDFAKCLSCGQCFANCPTETLTEGCRGYRILVGGKLGRHPQLGRELNGIFSQEETLAIIKKCLTHYMAHTIKGERFGEIINRTGLDFLAPYTLKTA